MSALVDQLVDAGIDARAYRRGPAGVRSFVASIDPHPRAGRLWIWEGRSKIDAATNKRHRQAVLNVAEEGRELIQTVSTHAYLRGPTGRPYGFLSDESILKAAVHQMELRWSLPKGTHFEGRLKFKPKSLSTGSMAQVTVRAVAPASNTALLVGMDETHHFVAQLPQFGVPSVARAHFLLKPNAARVPGTKRQGEWFFVPVEDEMLLTTLMSRLKQVEYEPLERKSSHHATVLHHRARKYAIGLVMDNRTGRHAPLMLTGFHEVVRNREIAVAPTPARAAEPQRRYWD